MSSLLVDADHVIGARQEDVDRVKSLDHPPAAFRSVSELITSTKAGDLLVERAKLVFTTKPELVIDAWKKLLDNKILSLPIYDNKKAQYIGFIDVVDIVEVIVNNVSENDIETHEHHISELLKSKPIFDTMTVGDVFGKREPFVPVETGMPLKEAMALMTSYKSHRLPVVDGNGTLITILSQSRIISYLQKFINLFPINSKPIGEIPGFVTNNVFSVTTEQKAIEAFNLIHEKKINGVAVVDAEKGTIVGNISASDLKAIGYNMDILLRLFIKSGEFIRHIAPKEDFIGVVCVTPKTTFEELIDKIALAKVHRLYVVDTDGKPVGVITLTDIIRYVHDHHLMLELEIEP